MIDAKTVIMNGQLIESSDFALLKAFEDGKKLCLEWNRVSVTAIKKRD